MVPVSTPVSAVPTGQYKVVSIAVDLTGKRLIDEICHIGAYYHPEKTFSQYVMPYRGVSQSSVRTHGIRVFTIFGKYRVLKEATTLKTLRTKSEYSTLCEIMDWLKEAKGDSDGVLLAFHDNNKGNLTPFLLEALNRYKLADDFFNLVAGFVDVPKYVAAQPDVKEKEASLRSLCKQYLTNDELPKKENKPVSMQCAEDRAMYTYKVLQKLTKCDKEVDCAELMAFCTNRTQEMKNLEKQRELAEEKVRQAVKKLEKQKELADEKVPDPEVKDLEKPKKLAAAEEVH